MERNIPLGVWLIVSGLIAGIIFCCCCLYVSCRLHNPFAGCIYFPNQRRIMIHDIPQVPQIQVNLRPSEVPIENSITPSAPRLDQVDLPPSYEEAVKMTMSTQV